MAVFLVYLWLVVAGGVLGINGWRVVQNPANWTSWFFLGVWLGIFASVVVVYVYVLGKS